MHDELSRNRIEGVVGQRQRLGRGVMHLHGGEPSPDCADERLGRVDGHDVVGALSLREHRRQGTRAAADVEHLLAGREVEPVCEHLCERLGPAAHERRVGFGGTSKLTLRG